jgi:hypothetical protein
VNALGDYVGRTLGISPIEGHNRNVLSLTTAECAVGHYVDVDGRTVRSIEGFATESKSAPELST